MIIAAMISTVLQTGGGAPGSDLPEPATCQRSVRDATTGKRLWCPGELGKRLPSNIYASFPADGKGKGWALLLCYVGEGKVTTACELTDESAPGSRFGVWAIRAHLTATLVTKGEDPMPGDQYYAIARWEVQ